MSNFIIASPAISDAGTISTSGTVASDMGIGNLLTLQPSERTRWTSLTGIEVTIDLGSAKPVDFVFLGSHNGTQSATWRIRGATTQSNLTTAPGYDSGTISMFATTIVEKWDHLNSVHFIATAQTFRWWRVDVLDGSNPALFFETGRLVVADSWQSSVNMQFGEQQGFESDTVFDRTAGGQTFALGRGKPRVFEFVLSFLSEDEMYDNAFELDRLRGDSKDIVFVKNPGSVKHLHRQMVQGLITELSPIANPFHESFEKRFKIVELL